MSAPATAPAPINDAKIFASGVEETNRLKGFLGTAEEMTSVAETLAPHSIAWVKSLSDDELFPLGEHALRDIADDILVLDEIRTRFRAKGSMRGYSGWKEFVEKNSRYSMRTIQNRLAEKNGKDTSKTNFNIGNMHTRKEPAVQPAPSVLKPSPKPVKFVHKNPAVDQLAALRKQFSAQNIQIQRVGGSSLTEFQVWVSNIPAKNLNFKGEQRVTVEMSAAQLRTVEGTVNIGANALSAAGVEKFLASLCISKEGTR